MGKRVSQRCEPELVEWQLPDPVEKHKRCCNRAQAVTEKSCIFMGPIYQLEIGLTPTIFHVHQDILDQLQPAGTSRNGAADPVIDWWANDACRDVDCAIFELVVAYFYGECYRTYGSKTCPNHVGTYRPGWHLERASKLYYFAIQFNIPGLKNAMQHEIEDLHAADYELVLDAAKLVYGSKCTIEPWFHEYVVAHTRRALSDNQITSLPWFVDVFCGKYNSLGVVIFEVYRDMCTSQLGTLTTLSDSIDNISLIQSTGSLSGIVSIAASIIEEPAGELTATVSSQNKLEKDPLPASPKLEASIEWEIPSKKEGKRKKTKKRAIWSDDEEPIPASVIPSEVEPEVVSEPAACLEAVPLNMGTAQVSCVSEHDSVGSALADSNGEGKLCSAPAEFWDFGLTSKERKKKRKAMEAEGILFDAFGNPVYPETEPAVDEPTPDRQVDSLPWHYGLTPKEKKKKRKDMEAEGILFDVFGDPVYPETEPAVDEPTPDRQVDSLPWDFGLSLKMKRKKKKEMEAEGVVFDVFNQPIYPDPSLTVTEAEAEADTTEVREVELISERGLNEEDSESVISIESAPGLAGSSKPADDLNVIMALDVSFLNSSHRFLTRWSIGLCPSLTETVLDCMPHCMDVLANGEKLWLSNVQMNLDGLLYEVNDQNINDTVLHLLRVEPKKPGIVHISMKLHSSAEKFDNRYIQLELPAKEDPSAR